MSRPAVVSPAATGRQEGDQRDRDDTWRPVTQMNDLLPNALPPDSALARRAAIVSCWLCGIRLHQHQMVPDGDSACPDIRWYCQDTRGCAERWTAAERQQRPARVREI